MSKEDRAYYFEICEEEGCQPIDTKSFLAFAVEGQPEYTFYTIDNINIFTDYVKLLAKQWLAEIV